MPEIAALAGQTIRTVQETFERFEFSKGLEAIWGLIGAVDKYIVQNAPWKLAKLTDADSQAKLSTTLYTAAEALRIATALLGPVLPQSAPKIWTQLGMAGAVEDVRFATLEWGQLPAGQKIGEIAGGLSAHRGQRGDRQNAGTGREDRGGAGGASGQAEGRVPEPAAPASPRIPIDDFVKVDLRVGQVKFAERVKGSDKLLHMKVDIGEAEARTIVAGIAEAYTPEQMLNRKVVIVANLQPRKLKGIESNGMIVAASVEGGKPVLAGFHEDIPVGARLK